MSSSKQKKHIVFVCNGNRFRSMSAQFLVAQAIERSGIDTYEITSAGLLVDGQKEVHPETVSYLTRLGIDITHHIQRRATPEILDSADVIIAMAEDQLTRLQEFGYKNIYLFNELAFGSHSSILDIEDCVENYHTDREAVATYIDSVIDHIQEGTPHLLEKLEEILSPK